MTYEEALAVATANNEIDENQTFLIDKNLRTVTIPDGFVLGVFNDKNVQIVPFAMPRYYNGIDMSTFAIQVNYVNSAGDGDIYLVFDQDVQEDLILFNWVVDRTAFATSGKTGFVVCMKEDDEYGYVAREFNTTLAYAPVLDGLEIDNPIDEQEVLDVLTQIRRAAERADIAAQQAEDSAAQASTDANTASNAASSASTSADTATAAQQSASASATSASNAETNALAYRDSAAASAAEAAAVVSGIEDVLSFPNALVVESATSEDIVTIEDGADNIPMTSVLATMNPIQDLNGQSNPYPPGGGKNLLNNTSSSTTFNGITWTVNSDGTVTANGTATAESIFVVVIGADELPRETNLYFSGCPSGGSASKYNVYIWDNTTHARAKKWNNITAVDNDTGASANNELYLTANHEYQYNMRVMSGQTVSNIVFKPMIRRATESDGTFAPYSNICPISGRSGMTVTVKGKNLLDAEQTYSGTISNYYFCEFVSNIPLGNNKRIGACELTAGTTYTISFDVVSSVQPFNLSVGCGRGTYGTDLAMAYNYNNGRCSITFTPTAEKINTYGGLIAFRIPRYQTAQMANFTVSNIQLEYGTSATAYEPYAGQTYPITWESVAGTVYGGTLDVVSGVLTVTYALLDSPETKSWFTSSGNFGLGIADMKIFETGDTGIYASQYGTIAARSTAGYSGTDAVIYGYASRNWIIVRDTRYNNVTAFKAALSGVQILYPLATPQTYQLTPTEVRTLLGGNTIYTDAGEVSVEYVADTKLYIDNKVAELQALILEN